MFNKEVKKKVLNMRKSGKSFEEISLTIGISKSTLSTWLSGTILDQKAKHRLQLRQEMGRKKVGMILRKKKLLREERARFNAECTLAKIPTTTKQQDKLLCALIYYCEGTKSDQRVAFTNSDPGLMKAFLVLFRRCFDIDESRFRMHMHLHSYHNEKLQREFWSNITNVPEDNFIKSFQKEENGVSKKEGYPGCVTIRYHDTAIARELLEIARQYFKILA